MKKSLNDKDSTIKAMEMKLIKKKNENNEI